MSIPHNLGEIRRHPHPHLFKPWLYEVTQRELQGGCWPVFQSYQPGGAGFCRDGSKGLVGGSSQRQQSFEALICRDGNLLPLCASICARACVR